MNGSDQVGATDPHLRPPAVHGSCQQGLCAAVQGAIPKGTSVVVVGGVPVREQHTPAARTALMSTDPRWLGGTH